MARRIPQVPGRRYLIRAAQPIEQRFFRHEYNFTAAERAAVAIVRALQDWDTTEPGLLVLDEPTASLNRGEVDALFREVRRVAGLGAGVLFVSHVLDEVLELADRVSVLHLGGLIADGPADEVREDPAVQQAYLGEDSLEELFHEKPTPPPSPATTPATTPSAVSETTEESAR